VTAAALPCREGEALPTFSVELAVSDGIRVDLQLLDSRLQPVQAPCYTPEGALCGQLILQQVGRAGSSMEGGLTGLWLWPPCLCLLCER
jgi:hypothetical protein